MLGEQSTEIYELNKNPGNHEPKNLGTIRQLSLHLSPSEYINIEVEVMPLKDSLSQPKQRGKHSPLPNTAPTATKTNKANMTDSERDKSLQQLLTRLEPMESMLKALKDEISNLTTQIQEIRSTTEDLKTDTNDLKDSANDLIRKADEDVNRLAELIAVNNRQQETDRRNYLLMECRVHVLESVNKKLTYQINDQENQARLQNIKIDGKAEEENENLMDYAGQLFKIVNPSFDTGSVMAARRLGKKPTAQDVTVNQKKWRPRTILVTLKTVIERNAVFFARTNLMKSENYRNIYLNDDVTAMTHKLRDDFRSVAVLARAEGMDVKVHGDGIILNNRKYRHQEADILPDKVTMERAKNIIKGQGLYFHSEHSFLSNFYPAPIIDNEIIYKTAEHRYQAMKCTMAGEKGRAKQVINAGTPLEAKKIGDLIQDTPNWRKDRLKIMEGVLEQKYQQNPDLAKRLINTGELTLHEATTNTFYGIGATLHSRELRDMSYKGQNKLGLALQELRGKLKVN